MSLGYETFEDNRTFEQEGLTGNVKRYTTEDMTFPCFVICADDEHPVELFKIKILQQMSASSVSFDEETAKLAINVYFNQNEQTITITKLYPKQVKSFLKLFENCQIDGYYDDGTKLSGDMLYVLAE